MTHKEILKEAAGKLEGLKGQLMEVLEISKPQTLEYAQHLAKVVSKLSPMIGNMIEFNSVVELNKSDWKGLGKWIRQDPGFPDTIFAGEVHPTPGIEIKTWFPLATEITARFKDSVTHFEQDQTLVALVAWLPSHVIYGKSKILDVWIGSARSLAIARDLHYHNPPDYLVFEPEDTSERTSNLQQTNTNGYKFQGTKKDFERAKRVVESWGPKGVEYSPEPRYQKQVKELLGQYSYRLDTNFAKIDRIEHVDLEKFKSRVLNMEFHGRSINEWSAIIAEETANLLDVLKTLI